MDSPLDLLARHLFVVTSSAQLLAYLALTVLCLVRIRQRWALVGAVAGALSVAATAWSFAASLAARYGDADTAISVFYSPAAQVLAPGVSTVAAVLLVVAVLMSRRPTPPEPDSGPTGTTFRKLPSQIRWE